MAMKLGFIGLGIMGRPMALNLRRAGHPLWVHGRRAVTMEPLAAAGALACGSIGAVATHAEVIFVMVSDTPDVERVIAGENGLLSHLRPEQVVVDMSTISPAVTRRLAQELQTCGVEMLDAPVSGGEVGAIDGTLSIMVGGQKATFQRIKPLLEIMGRNIVHVGDHGAGQVAKACNQIVVAVTIQAVSEALTFARGNGVDAAKVRAALLGGFAASQVLKVHGKRMLDEDFTPGFKVQLHQKDLHIVMEDAHKLGIALPGAALVAQHLNALMGSGDGELDSAAIVKIMERMAGRKT